MNSSGGDGLFGRRIAPFGNPRIKACLPLPGAYRSLPRPSSPCDAKASTVRPFALVRFFKAFSLGPTPRRLRLGAGPEAFASKPRARFDCLEIELLMSSHSNFSRLPFSKTDEIDPEPLFLFGLVVLSSYGRMVGPSDRQTIRPSDRSWWA